MRPRPRAARDRRALVAGVVVVAAALLITYGAMPLMRHWRARALQIDANYARLGSLADLIGHADSLELAAARAEATLANQSRRVMHARSLTLATSALQTLLQDAADASQLAVTRVEVAPDDSVATGSVDAGGTHLPATLSAYGDIVGITTLLNTLATGSRALYVERVVLQRNAALVGAPDVIQITLGLRAPVLPQ